MLEGQRHSDQRMIELYPVYFGEMCRNEISLCVARRCNGLSCLSWRPKPAPRKTASGRRRHGCACTWRCAM